MKILKILSYLTFTILFIGCSEDFLDVEQKSFIAETNAYNSEEEAIAAITSCYDGIKGHGMFGVAMQFVYYAMSDHTIHENKVYELLSFDADDGQIRSMYLYIYRGIAACNKFLVEIPNIKMDEKLKKRLIGEALFLRGFYNFYATIIFKEPPLILEDVLKDPPETQYGNGSREDFYEVVINDLRNAAARLPVTYGDDDVGRATKGAALAMLGKFYLYQQEWDSAYYYLDEVMQLGIYELSKPVGSTADDYINAYLCNFTPLDLYAGPTIYRAENNKESIFEVQNNNDQSYWNAYIPGYGTNGSLINAYFGVKGWRNVVPAAAFAETFESVASHPGGLDKDPRFYASIYLDGDTLEYYTTPEVGEDEIYKWSAHSNAINWQGYGLKKYLYPILNAPSWPYVDPNNWRVIRYADILLMFAEVNLQLGNQADADLYFNMIRDRAGMPTKSNIDKDDIIFERSVEFCFEILRVFDLIRWSGAYDIDPSDDLPGEDDWADPSEIILNFTKDKHEFMPIPRDDIDINGGKLKQNPGWE